MPDPVSDPWIVAEDALNAARIAADHAAATAIDADWAAIEAETAARWVLIQADLARDAAFAQYEAARALARAGGRLLADAEAAEDAAYEAGALQLLDAHNEVDRQSRPGMHSGRR